MDYAYTKFDVKAVSEDGTFEGYGAVFGNIDSGGDMLAKSALDDAMTAFKTGTKKPKMLWQHDPAQPIGVWTEMSIDDRGLKLKGRLTKAVAKAAEVYALMKDEAIDGLSIGYKTLDYEIKTDTSGERYRELKRIELWETSVVTFPMNSEATVTDVKQLQSPREVERLLRKAGVPGTFAKLLSLHGYEEAMSRLESDHREDDTEAKQEKALKELFEAVNGLKETLNA